MDELGCVFILFLFAIGVGIAALAGSDSEG